MPPSPAREALQKQEPAQLPPGMQGEGNIFGGMRAEPAQMNLLDENTHSVDGARVKTRAPWERGQGDKRPFRWPAISRGVAPPGRESAPCAARWVS